MSSSQDRPASPPSQDAPGISPAQATFFLDNGYLLLPGLLQGRELELVDNAMSALIAEAPRQRGRDPDFMFAKGARSGDDVLRRIEYVIDKSDVMKALLGHPFMLSSVERLQGPSFIPTWDSMVVKMPGEGVIVPWHRDDELRGAPEGHAPVFNVDMYLDDADDTNCVWVIPGSHKWTRAQAEKRVGTSGNPAARVERLPFSFEDAVPVPLRRGDAIFHDVKLVHGSPDGHGNALRRTVYYEFRPISLERQIGPHDATYIRLKQKMLLECIRRRALAPYAAGEVGYTYAPQPPLPIDAEPLPGFRVPHHEHRFNPDEEARP